MKKTERQEDRYVSLLAPDQYRREVLQVEPLTPQEETRLLQRVIRGNQERQQARPNQWVLSLAKHGRACFAKVYQPVVLRLAYKVVRQYPFCCLEWTELASEGNIILLEKLDQLMSWGSLDGTRAYLGACIRYRMCTVVWGHRSMKVLTNRERYELRVLAQAEQAYVEQYGQAPTPDVLAVWMKGDQHMSVGRVRDLLQLRCFLHAESIQALVEEGKAEEDHYSFVALYDEAVQRDERYQQELEEAIERARQAVLSEREDQVIRLRYGLGEACHSQGQIARAFGIRQSSVWRMECQAKARLHTALAPRYAMVQEEFMA